MTEEPECTIDSGDQWVSTLVNEARNSSPLVAEGVFTRLEHLLKGLISERELTSANLKTVATELIEDMILTSQEPEEIQ